MSLPIHFMDFTLRTEHDRVTIDGRTFTTPELRAVLSAMSRNDGARTIVLPPMPKKTALLVFDEGSEVWGFAKADIENFAREAVRLDRLGRIGKVRRWIARWAAQTSDRAALVAKKG